MDAVTLALMQYSASSGGGTTQETVTGNAPITLSDASAKPIVSLTQTGLCTQADTPTPDAPADIMTNNGPLRYGALGMNLLDPSAANTILGYYITKADGEVKPAESNFMFAGYMPVEAGKTYVAYGRAKTGNDLSDYNRIAWYDSEKTWIAGADYTQNRIAVATAPVNAAYARFSCNPSGTTTVTVTQELVDSYNWIFAEGTAEIVPFEPFVGGIYPDGTPEVLTVGGVNLCNPALYTGDGWYVGGNNTVSSAASNGTLVFPCKPNTTYSWWHTSGAGGARAFELTTDEVTAGQSATWAVGNPAVNDAMTVSKYTTSADAKLLCVLFARVTDQVGRTIEAQLADFMLVEGDIEEAFAYEPYHAPQTVNDVPMLLSVGDYKDEAEIISGTVTRRVGVKVLDGTEADWLANSADGIWMLRLWDKRIGSAMALTSTHFTGTNAGTASMPDNSIKFYDSTAFNYNGTVFIKATAYSTLDDFKAYLAAQYAAGTPVIVIYPLATETTESVAGQSLSTAAGTNIVSATAEVSPIALEAVYKSGSGSGSSGIWLLQCLLRTSQRKGRP